MQNSKKPTHSHVWVETTSYGIFFPDSTNTDTWLKTTDEGVTVDTVATSPDSLQINSIWLDEANDKLYYIAGPMDSATTGFRCRYIDLSDDSDNHIVSYSGGGTKLVGGMDCFVYATKFWYIYILEDPGPVTRLQFYNNTDSVGFSKADMGDPTARSFKVSPGVLAGDDYYFLWAWSDENVELWKADISLTTITEMEDCGANTDLSSNLSLRSIAYDGFNVLYFVLEVSGVNYLYSYAINTDTLTKLEQQDVSLMRNRNTYGSSGSPWEFEKAFHLSSPYIYQINRGMEYLLKLQDIGLTGGEVIIAISDKYCITDKPDLYKYTESISELNLAMGAYVTHNVPRGRFAHVSEFSTDQLIEIFENNAGTYTLCFRGKMGNAIYDQRRALYRYNLNNLGFDDLQQKVSYDASSEGIDEVVLALIGELTNPYIYADATSVPNIATNMTYDFDDERLRDALYVCAILGNGYWWPEPNGYTYFRAYSNAPPTGWYLGSGGFNYETVGTQGTSIDWVDSATLYDGQVEIIAEWQNHKNILRLLDDADAGEDPFIRHNITQATTGTFDDYVGTNDVTKRWWFGFQESGVGWIIPLYINGNKLNYFDNLGVIQEIQAVTNNVLYHIKIYWHLDGADTKFSVWVDGILKVDDVLANNNQVSGVDNFLVQSTGDSMDYFYSDAPGLVGEVDPKNITYVEGYNLYEMYSNIIGNMGNPRVNKHQVQFNDFSNVRGGWDETNSKPFEPLNPTNDEHIQQYGRKLWNGRTLFSGAKSQASLDVIVAGLKVWEGMVSNPINASFIINQFYYPVGYQIGVQFTLNNLIPEVIGMLITKTGINFKSPNLINIVTSTNIVRRR